MHWMTLQISSHHTAYYVVCIICGKYKLKYGRVSGELDIGSPDDAGGPGAQNGKGGPKWPELLLDCVLVFQKIITPVGEGGKNYSYATGSSVRPSVCPVDRQQQRRPAGLLLRSGAGSRYRSIAAAAARYAGRVKCGPTARRSDILVLLLKQKIRNVCFASEIFISSFWSSLERYSSKEDRCTAEENEHNPESNATAN